MTILEALKCMPKRKTAGEHFYMKNFNPWAVSKGDCAIRALSAALAMKYVDVCRNLNVRFKNGVGMMKDGVQTLITVPKSPLARYFDSPRLLRANGMRPAPGELRGMQRMPKSEVRVNVNDFCEAAAKARPDEIFVVLCMGNPSSYSPDISGGNENEGHVVAVFAERNHPYFVDTWDCGDMLVYAYMRVKRQVAKNSPERINIREFELTQREAEIERERQERIAQNML